MELHSICPLKVKVRVLVSQLCLTLCDPTDYTVHGFSRPEYWVGCHALLQGIFPTRGSNLHLPYCRQILYRPSHLGNPICPLGSAIFHLTLMFPRFFHVVECLKISFSISNSTVCIHHSFCPFLLQ